MKQSLQLKIGQQLAMTPQLQQAIRLLQLSTLDLTLEIQENLDANPMLEVDEEGGQEQERRTDERTSEGLDNDFGVDSDASSGQEMASDSALEMNGTSEDLPVDSKWDDVFDSVLPQSSAPKDSESFDMAAQSSPAESLQDHLLWQLQMSKFSERDLMIGVSIIDALDGRGFLQTPLAELAGEVDCEDGPVDEDEVLAVLHRIQTFDPVGVAARDLGECLWIQLQQLHEDSPFLSETRKLVEGHLDLLVKRDYKSLMSDLDCDEDGMRAILELLKTLHPAPGELIASPETEYIVPDVYVFKENGRWQVSLNHEAVPRIRINNSYASLVNQVSKPSDNDYMRQQLQEARWFVKSIQSRNETLLKVTRFIVAYQEAFFEIGDEAMRPMVLADVAEAVEMHESTVSRVTTRKYMHTPRGILELKYFFSSHVSTVEGGACSATAIRAVIKKLIAGEEPRKPLSDNKIATMLKAQGINVARRTVAKYRESMSIPTSSERKKLI